MIPEAGERRVLEKDWAKGTDRRATTPLQGAFLQVSGFEAWFYGYYTYLQWARMRIWGWKEEKCGSTLERDHLCC